MDYEGKSVLILGGGDGGILNMLRTRHNPKVNILWQGWNFNKVFIFDISIYLVRIIVFWLWFDSNFIPRNSKKFEYSNSD